MPRFFRLLFTVTLLLCAITSVYAGNLPVGVTLSRTVDGYIVELSLPSFQIAPVRGSGEDFAHVIVPGYGVTSDVGLPQLPLVAFNLMLAPGEATPEVTVIEQTREWRTLSSKVYPAQEPWPKSRPLAERPFRMDREYYRSGARTNQQFVLVGEPFISAGVTGVTITIYPFAYHPGRNELAVTHRARFAIRLKNTPRAGRSVTSNLRRYLDRTLANFEAQTLPGMGNYLLITAPQYESTLAPFVSFKASQGYPVFVATTTVTGTTNTAIKAYIQQRYNDPQTRPEFILLIGDVDRVPEWIGSTTDNPHTDLFYTFLDGTDYFPDAFIGRFSVSSTQELQNVISKTIFMENNITMLPGKNIFMASSDNWAITEGTHNAVIDTFFTPQGYANLKRYTHTYGATTQQVIDDLNANQTFAIYSGHGSVTSWSDGPPLTQSNVRSLTNTVYPFVYSFSCLTGQFHSPECFGETWIRIPKGGSAYWGSSVTSYWDEDDILEKRLVHAMFADSLIQSAPMFVRGKIYLAQHFGGFTGTVKRYFEMYNLLGDPSLHCAPYIANFGWVKGIARSGITPLPGVLVDFSDAPVQQSGTTGPTGLFLAGAQVDTPGVAATYTLRARKFGYLGYSRPVTIVRRDTITLDFSMAPAPVGTLALRAYRTDSAGIRSEVNVLLNGTVVVNGYADSVSGNFTTPLPVGTYDVVVNPPSPFATRRFAGVVIEAGQTTTVRALVRYAVEPLPSALRDTLLPGQSRVHVLTLTNTTADSIPFRITDDNARARTRFSRTIVPRPSTRIPAVERPKGAADSEFGASPARSGGPDAFGYRWLDSDSIGGGVMFIWSDITTVGTQITAWSGGTDDGYFTTTLPWSFPFYGFNHSSMNIVTNGFVNFGTTSTAYSNTAIPGAAEPNNAIYAFWDDLSVGTRGTVHYYNDVANSRFIVQYTNVPHLGATADTLTFQIILKPNGEVLLQYLKMAGTSTLTSGTIGMENAAGTVGLQVVYNAAYVHNRQAIRFFLPDAPWIEEGASIGVLPPNGTQNISIDFNTAGLRADTTYRANIFVDARHPDITSPIIVPASLRVRGGTIGAALAIQSSFTFGPTPVGTTRHDSITANNIGDMPLVISAIQSTSNVFTPVQQSLTIPPGVSAPIYLNYTPTAARADTGRLIVTSNSIIHNQEEVLLSGTGLGDTSITVVCPNGGERWVAGTTEQLVWRCTNVDSVKVEFSSAGRGGPWQLLLPAIPARRETLLVQVPNVNSNNNFLRVGDRHRPDIFDTNDSAFSIISAPDSIGWQVQNSGISTTLYAVEAVDANVAWASGSGGIILRTINRGANWMPVGVIGTDAYAITAVDANIGITATSPATGAARIWKTSNGGTTWSPRDSTGVFWDYLEMFDARRGIAFGDPFGGYWVMKRTTNGGDTWFGLTTRIPAVGTEAGWPNGMTCNDSLHWWFGTNSSNIYRTTDGGNTWQVSSTPFANAYSLWFNTPTLGLAISGQVTRSTDGGVTWARTPTQPSGTVGPMAVGGIRGTAEFWVLCGNSIFYTPDSGNTWTSNPPYGYRGATQLNHLTIGGARANAYGWAVGVTGAVVHYSRVTTDAGPVTKEIPTDFSLSQNFPNPFNPTTTIRYTLPQQSHVTLKIYNLLGQEVATLVNAVQSASYFDVVWDGRNPGGNVVSSGVYLYRLEATQTSGSIYTNIKKGVLLR